MDQGPRETDSVVVDAPRSLMWELISTEDWWANWLGGIVLALFIAAAVSGRCSPADMKSFLGKPTEWTDNPLASITSADKPDLLLGIARAGLCSAALFAAGAWFLGEKTQPFLLAFAGVWGLALLAQILAQQKAVLAYNIEFALWAIVVGLAISNTVGAPRWIRPALRTEFYIKTGLVIYGAGILLNVLMKIALPGLFVSWVVTPIVLVSTYIIGQRWIRIPSKTLNITISADMSVCGVSAAIATAAACRAKREELSLAVGISLAFTAIMMVAQPAFIKVVGMDPIVGGAWIGGTIDSTGAVAAAGAVLGDDGEFMAVTIKMIQNMLIGVIAFAVAVYWVVYVDRDQQRTVGVGEIVRRFPKFILGFVAASAVFTALNMSGGSGPDIVKSCEPLIKASRDWCFCLAFVSIGLETDFRQLASHLRGGKPILLYLVGQSINLALSFAMAYLMFKVVFPDVADSLAK